MQAQEPLTASLESSSLECWDEESTASALRALVKIDTTNARNRSLRTYY
jgi:hypothetical protein